MANLTYDQLQQVWISNGGPAEWAPTMAAIAVAESNGDPAAKNASGATGLWQTIMGAQGSSFQAQYGKANLTDPNEAAKVAIAQLTWGGGIHTGNWSADPVGAYVTNNGSKPLSTAQAQQFAGNPASATTASTTQGETGAVNIPAAAPVQPIAGADIKNFHGYDLTAFANSPDLGKAEQTVENYISNPTYKAKLDNNLATEYGYQTNWWKNIPQVNAVMLYAAQNLDPTTAASTNTFQSLLANTEWWKTSTSNARYWDEAYGTNGQPGTDPMQAQQALQNAQEKVLADANQMGLTLNKQEVDAIAMTYAKNNYIASGSFGTASGTAPEWLDQAITDTLFNIKGQQVGKIPLDFSTLAPGKTSTFDQQATGATGSVNLGGIAGQLYDKFETVAQQYMMYNPADPKSSLLSQQSLLNQVQSSLENYTGSGSSFGSSNLINGETARFTQLMKDQASKMYPSMAAAIAAGSTPQDYVAPYASMIGAQLGVTPASINFTSPQWNWVIATPDAKTGQKQALTLDQVQQKLTTLPQWQTSNTAAQMGTDVTTGLNKAFGFGGS